MGFGHKIGLGKPKKFQGGPKRREDPWGWLFFWTIENPENGYSFYSALPFLAIKRMTDSSL
jgi:hypothetical protein